jgi:hypothetical protein
MALNAKKAPKAGGNFIEKNPLDPKLYPARVVQVIDLGLQPQQPFKGQEKPPAHMIRLTYELSHEFMLDEDGNVDPKKPRWLSEEFPLHNLEADKARSTKRYNSIDPQGTVDGDFTQLTSYPCQVMVTKVPDKKNEGFFKNYVGDVSAAANFPGYEQPELVNPITVFDLDEPNLEAFQKLPEWLQTKIKANLEYQGSPLAVLLGESTTEAPANTQAPPAAPAPAPAPAPAAPQAPAPANPVPAAPPAPDAGQ